MRKPLASPFRLCVLLAVIASSAYAQQSSGEAGPGGPPQRGYRHFRGGPPPPMQPNRMFHVGPPGRWWSDPEMAKTIGLSKDQQDRMDKVFLDGRVKLIDLNAKLQKEQALLEPLLEQDQLDQGKATRQIDQVAQARAELEKANGRLLLALRNVLNPDQWKKLHSMRPGPRPEQRPEHPQD